MDIIIRTITKGFFPFIIVFGIFIMFHGHLTPGGSFPGGAIAVSGIALVVLVFGVKKAERIISEETSHILEGLVALILMATILYESLIRGYVVITGNAFELWSAQHILLLNVTGGIMVMMALTLIVFLMTKE
jgi:multicomponent Na+:H+ antiporter subunit B